MRRVHIPKGGSTTETRPLGIPTLEDKLLQRAMVMLLLEESCEGRGNCAQTAAFTVDDDWQARDKNAKTSAKETGCVT